MYNSIPFVLQVPDLQVKGTEGPPNLVDYLIVGPQAIDWHQIPDFVVGYPGYENWLVARAKEIDLTLVDATNTVLALHMLPPGGRNNQQCDPCVNKRLVTPSDLHPGYTHCTPFLTNFDLGGVVVLMKRDFTPSSCTPDVSRVKDTCH